MTDDENRTTDDSERTKREASARELVRTFLDGADLPGEHDDVWWARREAQIAEEKASEAREARRLRAQFLIGDDCAFPSIAMKAAVASSVTTPASNIAERYAKSSARVLVLAGGTGTGKTTAATWLALEVGGSAPAFLRAGELEARGRYDHALRGWLRSRSMLVLDDLGAEVLDGKGVFRSLLDEVVDLFYGDRKRLVITTNLRAQRERGDTEPQLVERYGARVVSRLVQVGMWGECGVRDLRREVAR